MTLQEIDTYLKNLYKKYNEEIRTVTSVHRSEFIARFARENGVEVDTNGRLSINMVTTIDDVLEVSDVAKKKIKVGFLVKRNATFPYIYTKGFYAFATKSKEAYDLKIGDKIRITGEVSARVYYDDVLSVSIYPNKTFSIMCSKA